MNITEDKTIDYGLPDMMYLFRHKINAAHKNPLAVRRLLWSPPS